MGGPLWGRYPASKNNPALDRRDPAARRAPGRTGCGEPAAGPCRLGQPLRQTWLNRPAPNTFDDIGRWRLEPSSQRLVLRGGREAPLFLQPLEGGAVLRKLDLEGQPIRSEHNDRLQRLTVPEPISPRLLLAGLFRLLPQGPTMQLCVTGQRLPVALEGDYKRLLQAYRSAVPAGVPGQPLLVSVKGLISQHPATQPGQGSRRALVVEAFGRAHPGQSCPQP